MSVLNFPSSPSVGQQYTGDNEVTYIFDGVKWEGYSPVLSSATNSISNNGHVVQVNGSGNLVIPVGATIIDEAGNPVLTSGGSGAQGTTGAQGIHGAQGTTGSTGAQGTTGSTGAQGTAGFNGNTGAQGTTGVQGTIGSTGAQGTTGNTGVQGATGIATTIVGSVANSASLPPSSTLGSGYIDEGNGDLYVWTGTGFTNVGQIVGPTGAQGTTGVQGTFGSNGAQGTAGTNGQGVPTGGTAGQVLIKIDSTDYNTQWITRSFSGSATTSTLVNGAFTATLDTYGNFIVPYQITNNDPIGSGVALSPGYPGQGAVISNYSGNQEFFVQDDGAYVQTSVNNSGTVYNQWIFGLDGVLTLPSTVGDIKRDGVSVLGGGGGFATTSTLINNSATVTLTTAGNLIVPGIVQSANTLTLSAGVVNPLYWWAEFGDFNVGTTSTYGIGVVHDPSGNLWVFGDVEGNGNGADVDTLALKYDQYGNLLWQAEYRDANNLNNPACASNDIITFDNVGNAYYLANDEDNNLTYIGKMDANGNTVNQELFYINGIAIDMTFDSNNHMLVVGTQFNYYNTVTTNTYNLPYIVKVDESYNILWQLGIDIGTDGSSAGYAEAVAVDASNNAYVTGYYNPGTGGLASFLSKVDTNGNLLWTLETGIPATGNPYMYGYSLGVNNGYLYALTYTNNGYFNVITKYDLDGNQIWQQISDDYTRTPNEDYYVEPGYDLNFDSAGNIYITSVGGGNASGQTAIILTKMEPTAGAVVYQRALMSPEHSLENNPYWWVGHRQASIYNDRIAISAYTQYSAPASTGTTTSFAFTIQMPIDGSITGTFNGISVNDVTAAFSTATYAGTYTSTVTSFVAVVTTATGNTGTLAPVTLLVTGTNTLTNNTYNLVINSEWQFSKTGAITFPDGTHQTTAYPGPGSGSGELYGVTTSTGSYGNSTISISNVSGYKRIDNVSTASQIWFDVQTIADELGVNSQFITGVTIDFQATSGGSSFAGNDGYGTLVGQIIAAYNYQGQTSVTHSETAVLNNTSGSVDYVFNNLNLWQTQSNYYRLALEAVRTDSNTGQQLDIIWTAKVFINPILIERYC